MIRSASSVLGPRALIGVVHLLPLPGSPWARSMRSVLRAALSDARALASAGFGAVLVENFGDAPFFAGEVPPVTVASMAVVLEEVRRSLPGRVALGVNVLRNDAAAAVSLSAACGLDFFRVNVHTGAAVSDQGILEGRAAATLRLRASLGCRALLLADVRVKHASPLAPVPLAREAADAAERGRADAILLTGEATGAPADLEEAAGLRAALSVPVLVASGVSAATVARTLRASDGVIVGSALRRGGKAGRPVDPARARALVRAARGSG